jgi:hypothetical protein
LEYLSFFIEASLLLGLIVVLSAKLTHDSALTMLMFLGTYGKFALILANAGFSFLAYKPDAMLYFSIGKQITQASSFYEILEVFRHLPGSFNSIGIRSYSSLNAIMLLFFGPYTHVMPLLNTAIYSLAMIAFCRLIQKSLGSKRKAQVAGFLFVLLGFAYPGGLNNSIINLRESMVLLGFTTVYHAILSGKHVKGLQLCIGVLLVSLARTVLLPVALAQIICVLIINRKKFRFRYVIPGLFGTAIIAYVAMNVSGTQFQQVLSPERLGMIVSEYIARRSEDQTYPYLIGKRMEISFDILLQTPERLFYLLLYPFPWMGKSYAFMIPTLDALFILTIGLLLFLSAALAWVRKTSAGDMRRAYWVCFALSVCGVIGLIALSFLETTIGGGVRHRIPFVLPFCAVAGILAASVLRSERRLRAEHWPESYTSVHNELDFEGPLVCRSKG